MPDADRTSNLAWTPNLSWITDGLAVGGSFPAERAEHLARALGIRAVVDLRDEARPDEALLASRGLALLHLPTLDHHAVSAPALREGVAFVNGWLDRGGRVLVHCEHGIGRSATLALCVLVSRGLAPLEALELAKSRRELVSPSPAQYEAWAAWLRDRRAAPGNGWEVPHFDAFKAIAYRHLAAR
jgi:protein-tyrosine phosphatase